MSNCKRSSQQDLGGVSHLGKHDSEKQKSSFRVGIKLTHLDIREGALLGVSDMQRGCFCAVCSKALRECARTIEEYARIYWRAGWRDWVNESIVYLREEDCAEMDCRVYRIPGHFTLDEEPRSEFFHYPKC